MLLQRHLVDYDAKQSLYIHKLNRTKKTMIFLRQLDQAPNLYYLFLNECVRRKQYANIFNQVRLLIFFSEVFSFFLCIFSFLKQFIGNQSIFIMMKCRKENNLLNSMVIHFNFFKLFLKFTLLVL